ncbi:MAG: pinensin family lanthipeptide [Bacteroidota bacterium]
MAKKFKLSELKVTSFVTSLKSNEQATAKGGFLNGRRALINHRSFRSDWTVEKSQVKALTTTSIESSGRRRSRKW